MEVDIDKEDIDVQKSINQIVDIIKLMDNKEKLPDKVKNFFIGYYNKDIKYNELKANVPLKDQKMEKYTVEILTYLSNKYFQS